MSNEKEIPVSWPTTDLKQIQQLNYGTCEILLHYTYYLAPMLKQQSAAWLKVSTIQD